MQRLKKLAVWVAATLGAAVIGAFGKSAYDAAKPSASIVDVRPALAVNKNFVSERTEIPVPQKLRQLVEDHAWTNSDPFREQSLSYTDLVQALDENEARMRRHSRSIERFQGDLKRLRELVRRAESASPEEKNELFDLWERNDGFIYGSLRGKFRRGNLLVSNKEFVGEPYFTLFVESVRDESDKVHEIWVVNKRGGLYSSTLMPETARDLPFQKEVALALAYTDQVLLETYLREVEEETKGRDAATRILDEIEQVRTDTSRWAVTVSISNSGARSVAFLPYAELMIRTTGLRDGGREINEDMLVPLEVRAADLEPSAIQVNGGSATLVTFASTDFIMDIPQKEVLVRAFEIGASDCSIRLFTAGGGLFTPSEYVSKDVTFASSQARIKGD